MKQVSVDNKYIYKKENERFSLQESEYDFPYHYIPYFENNFSFRSHRLMPWGLEYLTYMTFVAELVISHRPESLIDVGCGDGRLIHMIKHLVSNVNGIDLSEKALAYARAFNPEVNFICGDISSISEKYHMITLIEVLEHIPDEKIDTFVDDLSQIIRNDGYLVVSVPSQKLRLNPKHYRHYTTDLLSQQLGKRFEIINMWGLYNKNVFVQVMRAVIQNPLYVLNNSALNSLIWKIHHKYTYLTKPDHGSHIVCLGVPK